MVKLLFLSGETDKANSLLTSSGMDKDQGMLSDLSRFLAEKAVDFKSTQLLDLSIRLENKTTSPSKQTDIARYKIKYATEMKNWSDMAKSVNELIRLDTGIMDRELLGYVYEIDNNTTDQQLLKTAAKWIKPLAEGKSEIRYVYTLQYAQLLLKIHNRKLAKYWASKTITLAQTEAGTQEIARKIIRQANSTGK